jgi:lysophospholipase L1-like esterase
MKRIIIVLIVMCCVPNLTTTSAPPPRLIVLGDSIGVGLGASAPKYSYAQQLAAQLALPLDNRAIGGSTIEGQPVPTDLRNGDIVVWLTGYNDMRHGNDPAAYGAVLRAAVSSMTVQGATVYLGGCLPLTSKGYAAYGPEWDHGSDALVAAYTAQIVRVPGAHVVRIAYTVQNVAPDLVHPNDAGHQQIANSFLATMRRVVFLPAW